MMSGTVRLRQLRMIAWPKGESSKCILYTPRVEWKSNKVCGSKTFGRVRTTSVAPH